MPQLSGNLIGKHVPQDINSIATEVAYLLEQLSQDLDDEICKALIDENNDLAERLILPFMQAKKLAKKLNNCSGNAGVSLI